MSKKVFISYSHRQGDWVWGRLVPCLRAGGAEVLIDHDRFVAGKAVVGQMDATQDAAEISLLVLTPDYLSSDYCLHEMERAIARDPQFAHGAVIPVKRVECPMPDAITAPNPLWVNLCEDRDAAQWDLLLQACGADLGVAAPAWLATRDEILQFLRRGQSVNLVVTGRPQWRELIAHVKEEFITDLGIVDLERGSSVSRPGLVRGILESFGVKRPVPAKPDDLAALHNALSARRLSLLALLHLDHVNHRDDYGIDLFATLRNLMMESRKLVLLAQSRQPFIELLPHDHPLSSIDIKTVELHGR